MRNIRDLLFILKRSSLCDFLICMTVPLTRTITIKYRYSVKQKNVNNKSAMHLRSFKEGLVHTSKHC